MRIIQEIDIAAPRAAVWRLVADDEGRRIWMPDLVAVTYPAGRPKGDPTGTRFRETRLDGSSIRSYAGLVTGHVQDRLRAVALADAAVDMSIAYRLGSNGETTHVRYVGEFALTGGGPAILGMTRPSIEARVADRLRRLKAAAETARPR